MTELKLPLPALPLWGSGGAVRSLKRELLKEECKIQNDKQDITAPNVVWALAINCLTSSEASAYDPLLFSLPAGLSKC